ncbi:MBL fold metallo-hydrolase [Paenibacillus spongiae]|uniref:MBL fold metallo-hydrolase n=1 Tax=Paenibacillus spongiae TaxID=2909671 RepID=A0ABY5SG45_9BACL|nr:MBL fold metallo-hydrolase [Paenibacillus spongiae]UVI31675.1 MBL fold metallo-hydrolase [Paenibacillus spongiae]
MRITVLGPWGAYPKAGDATAGYLIEYDNRSMLVDCGSGVLAQLQKYKPVYALNSVLISHRHYDHVADLGCLQYACLIDADLDHRREALPIYIAEEPERELQFKPMKGSGIERIYAGGRLTEGELEVSFFKTFHEAYCVGMSFSYKGKKAVYTADTYYDDSLIMHCADADVLIAETSFYADMKDARNYGHMNAAEVGRLAKEAGVRKVVLTHLPHFGSVPQLASEVADVYDGEIVTAYSGLNLDV